MGRKKPRAAKIPIQAAPIEPTPAVPFWLKHFAGLAAALCVVTLLAYSNSFHESGLVLDNQSLILNGDQRGYGTLRRRMLD